MMKAAVIDGPGQPLCIRQVPKPTPGPGRVLIKVRACGVCYSEVNLLHGKYPFARYPTIPGHEIAGVVAETGPGVTWPSVGDRVGLPFLFSSCGHCDLCVQGNQILCGKKDVTGVSVSGGYAEYVVAPANHVVPIPDKLGLTEAGPFMCAGLTVFNALRRGGLKFGDRVAVLGIGGLGQLGIKFATAMGATVAAVSRSRGAEKMAREMGATHYIATAETPVVQALKEWGGANVILNTAPSTQTANDAVGGLAPDGTLVLLGYDSTPVTVPASMFIMGRIHVMGSPSGSPQDLRAALAFAADHNILPQVTPVRLEEVADVLARMETGGQRERAVITFDE